jgi:hypothetical protein
MEIKKIITHILENQLNEKLFKLERIGDEEIKDLNLIKIRIASLRSIDI